MNVHTLKFLQSAYKAFNSRDIDSAISFMHRDVQWPNGMDGDFVLGHEAVREYWTRQWKTIDPHMEPKQFQVDTLGNVIVTVHQTVRDIQGNLLRDDTVQHIYNMQRGLIKSMTIQKQLKE
jgi:hypothetical protein